MKPAIKTLEGWLVIALVVAALLIAGWFVFHGHGGADVFAALAAPSALSAYFTRARTKLKTLMAVCPPKGSPMTQLASGITSGIVQTAEGAAEQPVLSFVETKVASLTAKAGITDPVAVAYFQAAANNAVKGLVQAAVPILNKALTALATKLGVKNS